MHAWCPFILQGATPGFWLSAIKMFSQVSSISIKNDIVKVVSKWFEFLSSPTELCLVDFFWQPRLRIKIIEKNNTVPGTGNKWLSFKNL